MTTNWPGAVDSFSVKVDNVDDVLAAHVNNLQDPVVALETALGVEGPTGLCEGRLTLATGAPVPAADQAAKTTVYFTPYLGNRISLYDGSDGWITHTFTEKSVAVPGTTVTPFDVFAYSSGGAVTLEAVTWTNDTTRATALTTQDGIYVKTGATTRRYLGTCRTTSVNGQTEDSQTKRFVSNYYNRVKRSLTKSDGTNHGYAVAALRMWNNDATNLVEWVTGVREDTAIVSLAGNLQPAAAVAGYVVLSFNSLVTLTPAIVTNINGGLLEGGTNQIVLPALGYNFTAIQEYASGANVNFFTMVLTGSVAA